MTLWKTPYLDAGDVRSQRAGQLLRGATTSCHLSTLPCYHIPTTLPCRHKPYSKRLLRIISSAPPLSFYSASMFCARLYQERAVQPGRETRSLPNATPGEEGRLFAVRARTAHSTSFFRWTSSR